jgi:hypothetical protein
LGRFLSVDPLTKSYPELTPYQFASNTPIQAIDQDGLEAAFVNTKTGESVSGPRNPDAYPASAGWVRNYDRVKPLITPITYKNTLSFPRKEQEIIMSNGLGTNYIGPKSVVEANVRISRQNYNNAVASNIAGGPFGAASYMMNPAGGGFAGAAMDGVVMSFGGIPAGRSSVFPSAQNATKPTTFIPNTESILTNPSAGAARASKYSNEWQNASLSEVIQLYAPNALGVKTSTGKTTYFNAETRITIVADEGGNYFRIQNNNTIGKRSYLSLDGTNPTNKVENGKTSGRTQAEYNQLTHFNNTDNK